MAFGRMHLETPRVLDDAGAVTPPMVETLDGIPEWFIGPMLADLVGHEVGHTLGLRHNFKASSLYTLAEINSEEWKGKKPFAGSVMDYLPPNINMEAGEIQGDYAMIDIGPYDLWAIEYGYTFDDLDEGPRARRGAGARVRHRRGHRRPRSARPPLRLLGRPARLRQEPDAHRRAAPRALLDKFVKDGESWSKAPARLRDHPEHPDCGC